MPRKNLMNFKILPIVNSMPQLGGLMKTDKIALIASRMYGISLVKSRLLIEQVLNDCSDLSEAEVLKLVGEKSLFYINAVK